MHYWRNATVEQREAAAVHLEGAKLCRTQLQEATFWRSRLDEANFEYARLEGANLSRAHFEGANLSGTHLEGADLTSAFFDNSSSLRDASLGDPEQDFVSVADARWNGINLALVRWPAGKWDKTLILGDELAARRPAHIQSKKRESKAAVNQMAVHRTKRDETSKPLVRYEVAVRANRQIAVALQDQGLNELSAHFSYRAQLLQQQVLLMQRRYGKYVFSLLLNGLAGYGYRPLRSLIAYLLVIMVFTTAYYFIGPTINTPLSLPAALVMSVSSFHGRGFFPGLKVNLDSPMTEFAALEALIGLLIEIIFISTFTQRFFGK